jgi:hypothetical protein
MGATVNLFFLILTPKKPVCEISTLTCVLYCIVTGHQPLLSGALKYKSKKKTAKTKKETSLSHCMDFKR